MGVAGFRRPLSARSRRRGPRGQYPTRIASPPGITGWRIEREATRTDFASFWLRGLQAADHEEKIMDKDRVDGAAHQAKGALKETAGRMIGDKKTEAEGKTERAAGKVQNAVGGAKDAVRDAAKEWNDR
ncbi:MAG: CsbD family protein [Acetobacteraceae bacterium]